MSDSQPYVGAGRSVRIYPSVSYEGKKMKWRGPILQYKLLEREKWNVSAHTLVQFAPYEEEDASILEGMGDRSDTLLAGLDWVYRPLPSLLVLASFDADILGAYDGIQATLGLQQMLGKPWETFSGSLGAGLLLQDQTWTQYFVGVPESKATPERPAHTPGESFHPYLSAQLLIRISKSWSWFTLSRIEFLDETWRDSPLIADDYRLVTFTALNYSF
ncbi:MipA/OmpV family protein [Kiritimatiellaeota bacterium B1221]|nr:MipA/OmpV family protein [Kiritimatiellaeota bacterium B1221]